MKDGFIRVASACPNIRLADAMYNAERCVELARLAAEGGARVLALPELSLTGVTAGDFLADDTLLRSAECGLEFYIKQTKDLDMLSFVGLPVAVGDAVYNCAAAVYGGELLALLAKGEAESTFSTEKRALSAFTDDASEIDFLGERVVIGTDIIVTADNFPKMKIFVQIGNDGTGPLSALDCAVAGGANVIVRLDGEAEFAKAPTLRERRLSAESERLSSAVIYSSAGEGESGTDGVYAGQLAVFEAGEPLLVTSPFGERLVFADLDMDKLIHLRRKKKTKRLAEDSFGKVSFSFREINGIVLSPMKKLPFVPDCDRAAELAHIFEIQARGLAGRISRSYSKTAVIGVSGGLDSTLALLVCARAMDILGRDRKNIIAVTMPCFGTTERTKSNAQILAEAMGTEFRTVDIKEAVNQHFRDIGHSSDSHDVVYENSQARERTQILMDIANAEGGLVVGTGDLSELALGFATYNGDHMSMYGVNASVPKTLMRYMVEWYADLESQSGKVDIARALYDILATPISPELLPPAEGDEIAQCTESIIGAYELHDFYLYHMLKYGATPKKLLRMARATFEDKYGKDEIIRTLTVFIKRFFSQQFKRSCLPDGPLACGVSLSPRGAFKMPSDMSAEAWLKEIQQ